MMAATGSVAFFDRMFDEAMALLVEARDHVAERERTAANRLQPTLQLLVSCETLRVTARLTQVMAWLLVQKAIHTGELSRAEAREECFRLGGREVCLIADPWSPVELPRPLQSLLRRSHGLYQRTARLDDLVEARGNGETPPGRRLRDATRAGKRKKPS